MVNQRIDTGTTSATSRIRPGSTRGGQAVQQVTDAARDTVSKAAETATQQADTQLDKVSSGLVRVAETLHETGTNLRENEQGTLAGYVDKAAGQVERASDYLRVNSVNDIIDDVQAYARREPAVALAVAVGVGFLAARLLKASAQGSAGSSRGQTLRYQAPAASRYGNGA